MPETSHISAPAPVPMSAVSNRLSSSWSLAVIALGICWLFFFKELSGEWLVNAQYNYGFVVPLLGAALFWRRWPERPGAVPGNRPMAALVAAGLLFLLLPLRVVFEANPEWRLAYWVHGLLVLALSFCLLYRAGGPDWVKFFAFPLAFMLIAVPWPMGPEQWVIQHLMRGVAGLTVEIAGWLGIPALQSGNLIQVGAGIVDIDEACSGVRSLQSALMLSLFLGEMHRLTVTRRVVLLGASLGFDLFANLVRTSFLTWAAAKYGLHQMQAWHDTAGLLVMCIVLPSLLGLAHLIRPKDEKVFVPGTGGALPLGALPRWVGVAVVAWLGITEVATEIWYRTHESDLIANARWSVAWPAQNAGFKKSTVPAESLAILRCSTSDAAAWKDDEDNQWSAFLLRWNPGKNSAQLAKGHRPDICFPAAGASLDENFDPVIVDVGGVAIPFKHQSFKSGPRLLHVFYCLWSDRSSRQEKHLLENGSQASRWQAVLAGERNLGQQVLEVVVAGPDTPAAATDLFRHQLPGLIRKE